MINVDALKPGDPVKFRAKRRGAGGARPTNRAKFQGMRDGKVVLRWWTLGHDREVLVDPDQLA